jgi:glycosidase
MQWDASPHAGFSTGQPWLPISSDYCEVNVSSQLRDPQSMLSLYRALLKLRRGTAALNVGDYQSVLATESLLIYERRHDGVVIRIALNFSEAPQPIEPSTGELLLSSYLDLSADRAEVPNTLRPHEGFVMLCNP